MEKFRIITYRSPYDFSLGIRLEFSKDDESMDTLKSYPKSVFETKILYSLLKTYHKEYVEYL